MLFRERFLSSLCGTSLKYTLLIKISPLNNFLYVSAKPLYFLLLFDKLQLIPVNVPFPDDSLIYKTTDTNNINVFLTGSKGHFAFIFSYYYGSITKLCCFSLNFQYFKTNTSNHSLSVMDNLPYS